MIEYVFEFLNSLGFNFSIKGIANPIFIFVLFIILMALVALTCSINIDINILLISI